MTIGFDLGHDLDLNFQGQIWNFLYLSQKWFDCHETKSKHIDWTLRIKCYHWVWPWPWLWPWILKVKYGISYISAKNGPIATKRKSNISTELQASNVTNKFALTITLTFEFWRSNVTLMVKFGNSCISEWEGRLTLHKGGGSRSFMTMTMTIWWPRSGVWIYQIVTGVTSDVGVPSTHLVWPWPWIFKVKFWKCCISGMEGTIDMEQKGCESIGCYTHFVTFNNPLTHDLDLGFSRSNFEKVVSQAWDGRLTWN